MLRAWTNNLFLHPVTSPGTSVCLYRSKDLRKYQYFCFPAWTGGLYVTPTIAGSRPGALSAACWAVMCHLGEEGYLERTRLIMDTAQMIAKGVEGIPELCLQGEVYMRCCFRLSCHGGLDDDELACLVLMAGEGHDCVHRLL